MGSGWQGGLLDGCGTVMCGILVSRPGIESGPSAVKVQSPNHWTAREFPGFDVGGSAGLRPCLVTLEVLEEMLS